MTIPESTFRFREGDLQMDPLLEDFKFFNRQFKFPGDKLL